MGRYTLLLLCAVTACSAIACSVDLDAADSTLRFACETDDDCLRGFVCLDLGEGVKFCGQAGAGPDDCEDRDGDGFLAGRDCPQDIPLDCNDDPNAGGALINPGRIESCNDVDDNCNGVKDEDIVPNSCPKQFGVCEGATTDCSEGEFLDCDDAGLYGPNYQPPGTGDEVCDGLDNDCDGDIDEDCECQPGDVEACGEDVGPCVSGIQVCADTFEYGPCVETTVGESCSSADDCGEDAFCVDEIVNPFADIDDDCIRASDAACVRQVCRILSTTTACSADEGCAADESCVGGFCQTRAPVAGNESCNGVDDDCDGRIDNFGSGVCDTCPFGMVFVSNVGGAGGRGFCIDAYEAARPDATSDDGGSNEFYAVAREGVVPWTGLDPTEADEVCEASDLRSAVPGAVPQRFLCQRTELQAACARSYPYGDDYVADNCAEDGTDATLTGASAECCTDAGVCDLAGNLAEVVRFPAQGLFGGAVVDSGASDISCDAFELLDDSDLSSDLMGFRCCVNVN